MTNKILHVSNVVGDFSLSANVIGNTSLTSITLSSFDPLDVTLLRENYDNKVVKTEATEIIDFSEQNPFGEI